MVKWQLPLSSDSIRYNAWHAHSLAAPLFCQYPVLLSNPDILPDTVLPGLLIYSDNQSSSAISASVRSIASTRSL